MKSAGWMIGCAMVVGAPHGLAAATARDLQPLFEPLQVEDATLAPDGRHLAFSYRTEGHLELMIADLDDSDKGTRVVLGRDTTNTGTALYTVRYAEVPFLGWASGDRLVYYATDPSSGIVARGAPGDLRAINADGTDDRRLKPLSLPSPVLAEMYVAIPGTIISVPPLASALAPPEDSAAPYGLTRSQPRRIFISAGQGYRLVDPVDGRWKDYSQSLIADVGPSPVLDADFKARVAMLSEASSLRAYSKFPHFRFVPFPPDPPKQRETIAPGFEFDADDVFAPHSVPLGIGADPDLLYFASNLSRDNYAVFTMDLGHKAPPQLVAESPGFDAVDPRRTPVADILVRDRDRQIVGLRMAGLPTRTRWLDADLARWQERLDRAYPGFDVVIREWDDRRRRVLIEVNPPFRAGAWMVVDLSGEPRRLFAIDRSAFSRKLVGASAPVAFGGAEGSTLTGTLTRPTASGAAPLVIYLRNSASPRASGLPDAPNPDTQALAALGFAVLDLNYRGAFGFGQQHLGAGRTDADLRAIDDVLAAIRAGASWEGVDPARVALVGLGFGGYIALRAAALHPDAFRAVVTIDAPTVPERWLADLELKVNVNQRAIRSLGLKAGAYPDLREAAKSIHAKVLLMHGSTALISSGVEQVHATRLRDAMRKAGGSAEYVPLNYEFSYPDPGARAADFVKMEDFLRAAFGSR